MSRISYCALRKIAADESFMDKLKAVDPRVWSTLGGGGLGWLTAAALGAGGKGQALGAGLGLAGGFGAGHMYKLHKDLELQKAIAAQREARNAKIRKGVDTVVGGGKALFSRIKKETQGTPTGDLLNKLEAIANKAKLPADIVVRAFQGDETALAVLQQQGKDLFDREVAPRLKELGNAANIASDRQVVKGNKAVAEYQDRLSMFLQGLGKKVDKGIADVKARAKGGKTDQATTTDSGMSGDQGANDGNYPNELNGE